ncbi:MAG: T9SS type A sorting domain-containing protein [Sphingobacteriales bacterium]|nr:MAG: T9SS type A sorting domain-containing protein [Sphingobacteriales bacterium]
MTKKVLLLLAITATVAISNDTRAQCSFTPTVTPSNLILCPNSQDTIWTQSYDSYQWYKGGAVVPGATNQYYIADAFMDAGNYFKVEVTQGGCTEMSDSVMVDGWAFLPPFVMNGGSFNIGPNGETLLCPSDSFFFVLMQPYTSSIQWSVNGQPIPGADNDTLYITQSGSYTVAGAPAVCPNWVQPVGVFLDVTVTTPAVPVISQMGNTLVIAPATLDSIQWFLNGVAIPGANAVGYTPAASGNYTVTAKDGFCSTASTPFNFTLTGVNTPAFEAGLTISPNPATDLITVAAGAAFKLQLIDQTGRLVLTAPKQSVSSTISLNSLVPGLYYLRIEHEGGLLVKPVVKN